jgi:hypothetical protein
LDGAVISDRIDPYWHIISIIMEGNLTGAPGSSSIRSARCITTNPKPKLALISNQAIFGHDSTFKEVV